MKEMKRVREKIRVAIQQCSLFINEMRQRGVKVVEAIDTALSAMIISEEKQFGSGAIASSSADEIYSLEVLRPEIEDDTLNFTRFLIVSGSRNMASESGSHSITEVSGRSGLMPFESGIN
jgi:prephenate dehydratase